MKTWARRGAYHRAALRADPLAPLPTLRRWSFLEEIARVDAEGVGDLGQRVQLGVGGAILDPADELLVDAGVGRKRALRQGLGLPELPHVAREQAPDSSLRHPAGWTTDGA